MFWFQDTSEDAAKDSAFFHYMEAGLWYVFLYNDGDQPQKVSFIGAQYSKSLSPLPIPHPITVQ